MMIITTSVSAALITQELNIWRKLGPVKASTFVSLLFGLIFYLIPKIGAAAQVLPPTIPPVAMGASFVAMSSEKVIPSRKWMLVGGIIFAAVFLLANPTFKGYGGLLGTGACISVVITVGMMRFYNILGRMCCLLVKAK